MRILFISANQERQPDPIPPLGVCYVANAAREAGHQAELLDLNFASDSQKAVRDAVTAYQPDVIGLSLRNVDNVAFPYSVSYLDHYRRIVRTCRETAPHLPVVVGGSAYSLFPEEFAQVLGIDYGVVGEGEGAFVDLLHRKNISDRPQSPEILYPKGAGATVERMFPAWDLLDVERYFEDGGSINIQTKRGCPYRCAYCTYPQLEGRKMRQMSPSRVVDQMEHCMDRYGVDYFFFVDNVFNFPPAHSIAICNEIVRRGLNVRWTAYVSPAHTDAELFATYSQAGCTSVDFGTDAASDLGLRSLNKDFGREAILDCSRWCAENEIRFNHSVIFGVPGETRESIEEAIETLIACRPTAVTAMVGIRVYPNTPLAARLESERWIAPGQIGLEPIFYIEDEVREYLIERIQSLANEHANWIVPGLRKRMDDTVFQRLRARGFKGPLWKFLA